MKPLKLTGNFGHHQNIVDACSEVESTKAALDATEYGSEEYYEALKEWKSAKSEHENLLSLSRSDGATTASGKPK